MDLKLSPGIPLSKVDYVYVYVFRHRGIKTFALLTIKCGLSNMECGSLPIFQLTRYILRFARTAKILVELTGRH